MAFVGGVASWRFSRPTTLPSSQAAISISDNVDGLFRETVMVALTAVRLRMGALGRFIGSSEGIWCDLNAPHRTIAVECSPPTMLKTGPSGMLAW